MSYSYHPSDVLELKQLHADTVAAATVNSAGFDVSMFEYVLFTLSMGDGDTALACKIQESDTSGGTYTDVTGATRSFAATDDNKTGAIVVRCHGRKQFLRLNVVGTGGTSSVLVAVASLIGPNNTKALNALPTATFLTGALA